MVNSRILNLLFLLSVVTSQNKFVFTMFTNLWADALLWAYAAFFGHAFYAFPWDWRIFQKWVLCCYQTVHRPTHRHTKSAFWNSYSERVFCCEWNEQVFEIRKKSRSVQKGQQFYGVCSNHWFNQCALSIFRHWFVNIVIVVVISLITRQSIKSSLCLTYPLRLLSIVAASISGAAAPPFKPNIFLITSIAL